MLNDGQHQMLDRIYFTSGVDQAACGDFRSLRGHQLRGGDDDGRGLSCAGSIAISLVNLPCARMHLPCMGKRTSLATKSRFEITENDQTAYIEFDIDGSGWMTIWHTEVPPELRGRGIATELARAAFEHAKANSLQLDVICPVALQFLSQHPEYKPLVKSHLSA
jgi:predicted GNAT family acetyltransferase